MTAENPAPRRYDPLLDEGRRRGKKPNTGVIVGVIVTLLIHAGIFYFIWKSKFQPHYVVTEDTAVKVDLTKLAPPQPPPPPPPPPPTVAHQPPPIAPRATPPPPMNVPAPPPPLPPVLAPHVETIEPPRPVPPTPPAPPAPPAPPPILPTSAITTAPDNDDMQQYYPPDALREDKGGHAVMACTVTAQGKLTDCNIESESGDGFGPATLKLAHLFRVKPATVGGKPVESKITIPLRWQTGGG